MSKVACGDSNDLLIQIVELVSSDFKDIRRRTKSFLGRQHHYVMDFRASLKFLMLHRVESTTVNLHVQEEGVTGILTVRLARLACVFTEILLVWHARV